LPPITRTTRIFGTRRLPPIFRTTVTAAYCGLADESLEGERTMTRADLTEKILDVKRDKDLSWSTIAEEIGGYSQLFIMTALLGQMKLPKPQAARAAKLFGLTPSAAKRLNEVPMRGGVDPVPQDPTLYRFYEAMMVFGPALKELIHEEFGDGIMSAIDFDL